MCPPFLLSWFSTQHKATCRGGGCWTRTPLHRVRLVEAPFGGCSVRGANGVHGLPPLVLRYRSMAWRCPNPCWPPWGPQFGVVCSVVMSRMASTVWSVTGSTAYGYGATGVAFLANHFLAMRSTATSYCQGLLPRLSRPYLALGLPPREASPRLINPTACFNARIPARPTIGPGDSDRWLDSTPGACARLSGTAWALLAPCDQQAPEETAPITPRSARPGAQFHTFCTDYGTQELRGVALGQRLATLPTTSPTRGDATRRVHGVSRTEGGRYAVLEDPQSHHQHPLDQAHNASTEIVA